MSDLIPFRRGLPVAERLARRSRTTEAGCVEWIGKRSKIGYGAIVIKGRSVPAHRASYEAHVGPIAPGLLVCHRCDNRACVNPDHLFLGTHKENTQDMMTKGRAVFNARPGEEHFNAKLDDVSVECLRVVYANTDFEQRDLARWWGITQQTVSKIVRRTSWRHVA